jgi:hypothetical protein
LSLDVLHGDIQMKRCSILALVVLLACKGGSVSEPLDAGEELSDAGSSRIGAEPEDASGAGAHDSAPDDSPPSETDAASGGGSDASPGMIILGGPGCGLEMAAFCDTFDGPGAKRGRAGELDSTLWSAGRLAPQLPSGNGVAIGVGPATLPRDCRAGLPAQVSPSNDALICDHGEKIDSNHLLVAAAAQNYGQNSYRIRQPFDFAGRTGKVVLDAEAFIIGAQLGWVSVDITEDPINAPSFSIGDANVNNTEGSLIPRNAIEFQFRNNCAGYATPPAVSIGEVIVFTNYMHTVLAPNPPSCVLTAQGKLNHIEIELSQKKADIYASDASSDGVSFGQRKLIYSTAIDLPFTRGYVHITVHNHATLKYSDGNNMDAWIARFDNVSFDGPVLSNFREYAIPDALVPGMNAWNVMGPVVSVGYRVADTANGPAQTLVFKDVDLTGVTSARVSTSTWLDTANSDLATLALRYRLNGGSWHDRVLSSGERWHLTNGHSQGQLGQILDVPLDELVDGDNTLEFVTKNIGQNYPPLVANIDLVLSTQ